MHNWSTNTTRLKNSPDQLDKFELEQRINFGLTMKKLSLRSLRKHWDALNIDENKRNFLQKIVWPEQS